MNLKDIFDAKSGFEASGQLSTGFARLLRPNNYCGDLAREVACFQAIPWHKPGTKTRCADTPWNSTCVRPYVARLTEGVSLTGFKEA